MLCARRRRSRRVPSPPDRASASGPRAGRCIREKRTRMRAWPRFAARRPNRAILESNPRCCLLRCQYITAPTKSSVDSAALRRALADQPALQRFQELHQVSLLLRGEPQGKRLVVVLHHVLEGGEPAVVVVAALAPGRTKTSQRRGPVSAVGRARRREVVDADLGAGVRVPAGLRIERRDMALGAAGGALEDGLAALRRRRVEAP